MDSIELYSCIPMTYDLSSDAMRCQLPLQSCGLMKLGQVQNAKLLCSTSPRRLTWRMARQHRTLPNRRSLKAQSLHSFERQLVLRDNGSITALLGPHRSCLVLCQPPTVEL